MATDAEMPNLLYAARRRVHKLGSSRSAFYRPRLRGSCIVLTGGCTLVVIAFVVITTRATYSSQRIQVSIDLQSRRKLSLDCSSLWWNVLSRYYLYRRTDTLYRPIISVGFKDLWLEDKDKDFPRGQQHWVTVKSRLLTDIIISVSKILMHGGGNRIYGRQMIIHNGTVCRMRSHLKFSRTL